MKAYVTLNQLTLKENVVLCPRTRSKKLQKVHQRQGDLDGACGAYSIVMCLLIQGVLNAEDITDIYYDGRYAEAKIAKAITEENGLYKDGLDIEKCEKIIRSNYSKYVTTEISKEKNEQLLPFIEAKIKESVPVILRVDFKGSGSHWLVVVGIGYNEIEKPEKLLCLDSGFSSPTYAPWNSVIDLEPRNKGYRFTYETNDNRPASIIEALAVIRK